MISSERKKREIAETIVVVTLFSMLLSLSIIVISKLADSTRFSYIDGRLMFGGECFLPLLIWLIGFLVLTVMSVDFNLDNLLFEGKAFGTALLILFLDFLVTLGCIFLL